MRVNIWIVLAILTVLFGMTRYLRHQETPHTVSMNRTPQSANVSARVQQKRGPKIFSIFEDALRSSCAKK
jgi:hypothetical protein